MERKYLFGPVASRRLGRSLGVDMIPAKTCPYDCIYCEVGRTTRATAERGPGNPADEILAELESFFAGGGQADYITFTGSGEPTLSTELGRLIREAKSRFAVPVAVITNGALLGDAAVRGELMEADLVMPSLDAARVEAFRAANRPVEGLDLEEIIAGIASFTREFAGQVWLEVLVVDGVNDSDADVEALAVAIARISPARVQLNTVARPPAESFARPVPAARLEAIAERLAGAAPTEIVAPAVLRACVERPARPQEAVLETLKRRPCTVEDLEAGLSLSPGEAGAILAELISAGKVRKVGFAGGTFYEAAGK